MEAKHTPGPWEAEFGDHTHSYVKVGGADETTVHYLYVSQRKGLPIAEANAHLIAAAPDLLEALKEVLDVAEMFVPAPLDAPGFKRARAAISKAEGKDTNQ